MMSRGEGGVAVDKGLGALYSTPMHSTATADTYDFQRQPPHFMSGEVGRPSFDSYQGSRSPSTSRLSTASMARSAQQEAQTGPSPVKSLQRRRSSNQGLIGQRPSEGSGSAPRSWQSSSTAVRGASSAADSTSGNDFGGGSGSGWTSGPSNGWQEQGSSNGLRREGSGNNSFDGNGSGENGDGNDGGRESPSAERERENAAKKSNPLVDLIETETAYVGELSKIIKKVAGAWSRSNFPPAELDTMFRNVESIYRVNRSFLKSLKEIGPNPSSPRALGDLLMRWIDDLETPYLRYCDNYFTDFDNWPSVQSNGKLPPLLAAISEGTQADGSIVISSDKKRQVDQPWTLDQLFALPQIRLRYYKKLYARLLKSTQSGRSDHRLLVGANEKLDELLQRAKRRIAMSVLDEGPVVTSSSRQSQGSSVGNTTRTPRDSGNGQGSNSSRTSVSAEAVVKTNKEESNQNSLPPALQIPERAYSPLSIPQTLSSSPLRAESPGLASRAPHVAPTIVSPPLAQSDSLRAASDELEERLDTSRTLDIFTLKPKLCQLRMNPPNIPFIRSLRRSSDVIIYYTPSLTGQEIVYQRAHIFLLSDLFLICERMTAHEKAERGGAAEMWLLFPPLAGKHLRVTDNGSFANSISIAILKKETLTVHLESREAKLDWLEQFDQCNKFASSLGLKVKTSSDAESTGSKDGSTTLMPARNGTPSLSPAISVTPSTLNTAEEERGEETGTRDMSRLLDELSPLGGDGGQLSRISSFNSFVMPPLKSTGNNGVGPGDRQSPAINEASPAIGFGQTLSPEPISPPFVASRPFNGTSRPPVPPPHSSASSYGSAASAVSPPMGPSKMQFQGARPGMIMRPPAQMQSGMIRNDGPPSLPTQRPPPHLLNGIPGNVGRLPRPSPQQQQQQQMMNGQGGPPGGYGRPMMPPRPPFQQGMSGPGFAGRPPPVRPPHDPTRRPSAPDLRSRANGQENGRGGGSPMPGRSRSASSAHSGPPKLPSDFLKDVGSRPTEQYSPPSSPTKKNRGPVTSVVAAQMRCRLYLKQSHAQWKSLGNARIKVYHLMPDDVKQLVVENDKKSTPIISSIILPDGVERVGKVGVAIELSDSGNRTGIVYMVHLRSEESAVALFGQLLEGSDRSATGVY